MPELLSTEPSQLSKPAGGKNNQPNLTKANRFLLLNARPKMIKIYKERAAVHWQAAAAWPSSACMRKHSEQLVLTFVYL